MAQGDWFRKQHEDPSIRMYAVEVARQRGDGKNAELVKSLVGVAGLTDIDFANSRAEFSLYVAPEAQGQGLGRAALRCLLTHGLENLGLNLIWGEVFEGNPALKMFLSLGFKVDGNRREHYWKDGKRIGTTLISIKRDEVSP